MFSNPMHQAVEELHTADGMLNDGLRGGLLSVLFLLLKR
jgi:hypothetical protein